MSSQGPKTDLTGRRFGKLIVEGIAYVRNNGQYYWNCHCDCGNDIVVLGTLLRAGKKVSCGCYRPDILERTHGLSAHPLYAVWSGMKQRCNNPNSSAYKNYGGRGIKICSEWQDNFVAFFDWSMNIGGYQEGLTLDRIDNNKDYSPENCRFVSMKVQNNNRRDNRLITFEGQTKTLAEWAELLGISASALGRRLNNPNWSLNQAMTQAVHPVEHFIEWNGEVHSKTEWAELYGIPIAVLDTRLRLGWPIDRALLEPINKNLSRKSIRTVSFDGKEWRLKDLCLAYNLNYNTVLNRLHHGWTVDEAVKIETVSNQPKRASTIRAKQLELLEYKGQKHTQAEWAKISGLGDILRSRLALGWSLAEAIERPVNINQTKTKNIPVLYNGEFLPMKEHCQKHGRKYNVIMQRMSRGMTFEQAMSIPVKTPKAWDSLKRPDIDGVIWGSSSINPTKLVYGNETLTLLEWSKKLGVSRRSLLRRLEQGLPVHQILGLPELPK